MRYTYASFKGYIGFYNGLGLERIEIDFSKCKGNIILITGINGCGKSTLMNALSLFPDPSSSFVPNVDGEKILRVFDNGNIYDIGIFSPSDTKGGRKVTKAYISKNGQELNTNGNVTSYKEIIFSEFELDSNYISLSRLSGDDRGLGDKTPAERKKFVSRIIENLEVYNDIFKTLNKKSLVFKSHINTLHTKIQNIGTRENLESTISSLKRKEEMINSKITELNNKIIAIEAKSSIDENEAKKIQDLNDKRNKLSSVIDCIRSEINSLLHQLKIKETDVYNVYDHDIELQEFYKNKLIELNSEWKEKTSRLSDLSKSINEMEIDLTSYRLGLSDKLESMYNDSNSKIEQITDKLSGLNIKPDVDLIFIIEDILGFYSEMIEAIDNLYATSDSEMLKFICLEYDPNILSKLKDKSDSILAYIEANRESINKLTSDIRELSILESKPEDCNNPSCPFISKALEIKNTNHNVEEKLEIVQSEQIKLSDSLNTVSEQMQRYAVYIDQRSRLDYIVQRFERMSSKMVLVGERYDDIYTAVANMNMFNGLRNPFRLISSLNLLRELKAENETNMKLKLEFQSYKEKMKLIKRTSDMITRSKEEEKQLTSQVNTCKKAIDDYTSISNTLTSKIVYETKLKKLEDDYAEKCNEIALLDERLDEYREKSFKIMEQVSHIQEYRTSILDLSRELTPIIQEIGRLSGQLTMLESYYMEFEQYKQKYNMIETLKKYCSPTNGGIQTIFMQLYMSKTLNIANQVLGMLFGGEYRLLDFVINESEFRIPFVGSGLTVDDISSGSTSQISIMGMAINLSLLYQASTKFNIARLDEIDGGLDYRNRSEFVNTLFRILPILNIEQLFTISHSLLESDTSSLDIIKLKTYSDFSDNIVSGNIIYDYEKVIGKTS